MIPTGYLERSEGKLAYSDYGGDGELVLTLPGMGALRSEYRFLAPQLQAAGFRPISVDLRGHGESSVPWPAYDVPSVGEDILALVDHFGAGPAHVIATSFTPGAAVWAAAERPAAIRSLVLIGAFVRNARINPLMQAVLWLMMHNPWQVALWGQFYRRLYPTRQPHDFEAYMAALLANLRQPGRFAANRGLGASSRAPSEERLTQVRAPVLVVMGTRDPDFPDPAGEAAFIASQTGGSLVLIEGAGHYPQTELPDQTGPVIVDFLKKQATPA